MLHDLSFKFLFLLFFFFPFGAQAQEVHQDFQETIKAEVIEIISEEEREVIGTDVMRTVQTVRIELEGGERAGERDIIETETVTLEPGDDIFVMRTVTINGDEYLIYSDFERRPVLLMLVFLFVALLLVLSRWHGVRALLSLCASVGAILFLLVPALLAGYDPALTTIAVAAVVMAFVLFGTHGINPCTTIAFGGMFSAVVVTGIIAFLSVYFMHFTGLSDDAAVYLNFATDGSIDMTGLLLGAIIIGILGVLDDVSITQASVVQELKAANPNFTAKDLYKRAIKVGRDHIGSLVNTLALAYAGVSLPLILLYAKTESDLMLALNHEVVSVELVRIIVGSIGLVMAVPATTFIAAWYFQNRTIDVHEVGGHHHHHH